MIISIAFGIYLLRFELRSAAFLIQFLDPKAKGLLVRLERHEFDTQELTLSASQGPVRARLYLPRGVARPPGMVLVHGIHHLGMDEPRLVNFARAAASNGFSVLTPEVTALADYHVDGASISTIGESSAWLQHHLNTGPVTVVGVSFAGGLSLLAACDPRYAPHIRSLVLIGAYDNLSRVARFLATSSAELPDGRMEPYKAHDYGAAVYVYSHLNQFFPESDLGVAHDALRDWLWEQPTEAQALFSRLSPPSRAKMEILLERKIAQLQPQLLESIQADGSQLNAISPEGKLAALRAPVFILHGSTDDIIPSTESLWLEKDIPHAYLRDALITPAFSHVDPEKNAVWADQLRLVEFLARVLRAAN
ncbi:MAG TPA: alpha/beta fold hydrolase [Candidatus Saccharimonadales bacterium]|nr:alpha/beta fold hydrolase [Candidatus Saccharimonadales bacterium]